MKLINNFLRTTTLTLCILLMTVLSIFAQTGNWVAGSGSISPSSPIPSCTTVTVSGTFSWSGFGAYNNDNHLAELRYSLPPSIDIPTGAPSLINVNTSQPILGVTFTSDPGGYKATFAQGTVIPGLSSLRFEISGLQIKDDQSYVGQGATHFISFVAPPTGENPNDNSATLQFSTTQVIMTAAVTGVSPICSVDTAVFTISGSSSDTVQYNLNGGPTQTVIIDTGGSVEVNVPGASSTQKIFLTQISNGICTNALMDSFEIVVNPTPAAPTVNVTQPPCATANGAIDITAPLGAGFEYSVDSTNFISATSFSAQPNTYNISARNNAYPSCISAATTVIILQDTTPCGPNVTVGASASPSSIPEAGTSAVTYFVNNTGMDTTIGLVRALIVKPVNGTLTLNLPSGWSIQSNSASNYVITTMNQIPPGLANSVSIPGSYVHDGTNEDAVRAFDVFAEPGTGGELITNDNSIKTFVQIN